MTAHRPGPPPRGFAFTCPRVEALTGQGPVLDCDHCRREVHDLSALTRDEALAVLAAPRAPCVRVTVGLDGCAVFRGPAPTVAPIEPRSALRSRPLRGGLALSGVLVGALAAGSVAASPPAVPSTVSDGAAARATHGAPLVVLADAAARLAAVVAQAEREVARTRRPARNRRFMPRTPAQRQQAPDVVGGEVMDDPCTPPADPQPARAEPSRPPARGAGVLPDEW